MESEPDLPSPHHPSSCHEQGTAELTISLQPDRCLPSPPASAFSFPTLNLDGSLTDLTAANASLPSYPPTAPAALSSRGAEASMAKMGYDFLSDGSIDGQYDMIDDISDLSNDDHDTASLLSTQDDEDTEEGEMTPEGSMVDLQDEQHESDVPARNSNVQAQNDLIDSYLSEDIETPRQSIVRDFLGRPAGVTSQHIEKGRERLPHKVHRVLFVSEPDVTDDIVSDVCLRIASFLLPEGQAMDNSVSRSIRLPPTSSGINACSVLQVRLGEIEMLVNRCVDATRKSSVGYVLDLQGPTKLQNSTLRVSGKKEDLELEPLDLIVYYSQEDESPFWFKFVHWAVAAASSLAMHITAPGIDVNSIAKNDADFVLTEEEFFHEDDQKLRTILQKRFAERPNRPATQRTRSKRIEPTQDFFFDNFGVRMPFSDVLSWKIFLPFLVALVGVFISSYPRLLDAVDPVAQVTLRRDALNTAWLKNTNSTNAAKAYNISHLLPYPEMPWPSSGHVPHDVRFQTTTPNHIIISLPQDVLSRRFPTVTSTHVHKRGVRLEFNQTQLVPGVYDITIHEHDANGMIMVTMDTKNPAISVIAEPNFGMSALYRKTYEKASMEISKAINKDVMVARKNAKSIRDKLGLELSAGTAATRNVTSELAIYIARDLQVLANTAVSVFAKAAAASNESAANFKKELAIIRKDLMKLSSDVQKSLVSTAGVVKALIPAKKTLQRPILVSKVRARRLRDRIVGSKAANGKSSSTTKDLALRFRNFIKPDGKGKKAGRLQDIMRCAREKDYLACRRAQKAQKAVTSVWTRALQATPTPSSNASPASTSSSRSSEKCNGGKPSLDPRKTKEKKKKLDGPRKGKKGPKHGSGKRKDDGGIKKNAKKTNPGVERGKKWPLR